MVLVVTYARESKVIKSILLTIPIYMIKFQNFFIIVPIILIYFFFKVSKNGMGVGKAFTIIAISFLQ